MAGAQVPIYIHVDIAVIDPVNSFVMPLEQPIEIERHACYTAKMQQIYIVVDQNIKECKYPCYLFINDMWKSNLGERHIVRRQVVRRNNFKTPDAACLLPNCDLKMHTNIPILPPAPGIYNHLEFSLCALNATTIPFTRLVALIEIQQCRKETQSSTITE